MHTGAGEHRNVYLDTVNQVIASVDIEETLSLLAKGAKRLTGSETVSLMFVEHEENKLCFRAAAGVRSDMLRDERIPLNEGIAGIVAGTGKDVIINHASKDPLLCRDLDPISRFSPRNLLCVPLTVKDETIGALLVLNKKNKDGYGPSDLDLLKSFAKFAALAINQRRLYQKTQNKAYEISVLYILSGSVAHCKSIDDLFQENVRIVCEAFQADRVSLIIREGDDFAIKASVGIPETVLKNRRVSTNGNILGYMVRTGAGIYSQNICKDNRFERNHAHNYRGNSFVAAPLKFKGKIFAFLCVTESKREMPYEQTDLFFLEMIARQVMENYNHAWLTEEFKQKQKMEMELSLTARMQQDILPSEFPSADLLEIDARNIPAKFVGGDFYDYIPLGQGKYAAVIADVSGKGISAGLFMAMSRSIIRGHFDHTHSPSRVLELANKHVCNDSRTGKFVTCFCCVIDTVRKEIVYANAGHSEQYLLRGRTKRMVHLEARLNLPLGVRHGETYKEKKARYEAGDTLLFYTDGVTEAVNAKQEQYGERRLRARLRRAKESSSKGILHQVISDVRKHQGEAESFDDITLMVITHKEPIPPTASLTAGL